MAERVLFSVVEMDSSDGSEPYFFVNWHPDILPLLEDISPNYQFTDKLINLAEEIREAEAEAKAEPAAAQS